MLEGDGAGGITFGNPVPHDPVSLKAHLDSHGTPKAGEGRVFILEGLHPNFIAVLGAHFKMHPSIFVDHERIVVISPYTRQESD